MESSKRDESSREKQESPESNSLLGLRDQPLPRRAGGD